jgi:hypothetical protein
MKTPQEIERLKLVEQSIGEATNVLREVFDDSVPPEMMSLIFGTMLAAIDATFAIRDGQSWRGESDPREIARKLLREGQLGE